MGSPRRDPPLREDGQACRAPSALRSSQQEPQLAFPSVDDIEGWPEVTGTRGVDGGSRWTARLLPEGVRLTSDATDALVPMEAVYVARQRDLGEGAGRLELEWITSLGEERTLALHHGDNDAANRLVRVIRSQLEEADGEHRTSRLKVAFASVAALAVLGAAFMVGALVGPFWESDKSECEEARGTYEDTQKGIADLEAPGVNARDSERRRYGALLVAHVNQLAQIAEEHSDCFSISERSEARRLADFIEATFSE